MADVGEPGFLSEAELASLREAAGGTLLAAGAARVFVASPDPRRWSDTGLEGALTLVHDLSIPAHVLRLFAMREGQLYLCMDVELYENSRYFPIGWPDEPDDEPARVHAFEADDFVMGFGFGDTSEAQAFLDAVHAWGPKQGIDPIIASYDLRTDRSIADTAGSSDTMAAPAPAAAKRTLLGRMFGSSARAPAAAPSPHGLTAPAAPVPSPYPSLVGVIVPASRAAAPAAAPVVPPLARAVTAPASSSSASAVAATMATTTSASHAVGARAGDASTVGGTRRPSWDGTSVVKPQPTTTTTTTTTTTASGGNAPASPSLSSLSSGVAAGDDSGAESGTAVEVQLTDDGSLLSSTSELPESLVRVLRAAGLHKRDLRDAATVRAVLGALRKEGLLQEIAATRAETESQPEPQLEPSGAAAAATAAAAVDPAVREGEDDAHDGGPSPAADTTSLSSEDDLASKGSEEAEAAEEPPAEPETEEVATELPLPVSAGTMQAPLPLMGRVALEAVAEDESGSESSGSAAVLAQPRAPLARPRPGPGPMMARPRATMPSLPATVDSDGGVGGRGFVMPPGGMAPRGRPRPHLGQLPRPAQPRGPPPPKGGGEEMESDSRADSPASGSGPDLLNAIRQGTAHLRRVERRGTISRRPGKRVSIAPVTGAKEDSLLSRLKHTLAQRRTAMGSSHRDAGNESSDDESWLNEAGDDSDSDR